MKHLSIGERLRKAGTLAVRREIAHDWARAWQDEHDQLIRNLERAVGQGRTTEAGRWVGQIKTVAEKKFAALPNVIDKLADEDMV